MKSTSNGTMNSSMKKTQVFSWCLFDFACTSYSAVILTVIFPVYYVNVIVGNAGGLGDLWWGRAISLSMAIVALSSPFVGGIADYAGLRKRFLVVYTLVTVTCVSLMALLKAGMATSGFVLVVLATIGFEGGLVFYNSYLNVIAPKGYHGRVSAWGFGLGYLGSFTSLLLALPFVKAKMFGTVWPVTAAFFLIFATPSFLLLPRDTKAGSLLQSGLKSMSYFRKTFGELWKLKELKKFLISFFIFMDGTNTVIVFSSIFAATTLGFKSAELIYVFMIVQLTAFAGAMIMARPIDKWGAKNVIMLSLVLWSAITVAAYFIESKSAFYVVSATAGLGLGTVQAAARAFFSGFIPPGKEAEYFGVYSMIGKTSAILGPLLFGGLSAYFGSQRPAILSIIVFFTVGLVLLFRVRDVPEKYVKAAGMTTM